MQSTWLNFTGFPNQTVLNQNFQDTIIKSSQEQKDTYFRVATACQDWYTPVFSNDVVIPPKSASVPEVPVVSIELKEVKREEPKSSATASSAPAENSPQGLTMPPIKIEERTLLNALLIGLGAALVVKILL
ncbi:MAG: hypothetical protein FJZ56_02740 [Chlamydiae bacterium]|nr:hypothetical protein [Chlamydiota bacterium]